MRAPFRSLLRRLMATGALGALLAAGPGVHRAAAQARYAIEDLGTRDEAGDAFSINDRGEVTGTGQIVGLGLHQGQRRPFRLTP